MTKSAVPHSPGVCEIDQGDDNVHQLGGFGGLLIGQRPASWTNTKSTSGVITSL